MIKTKIRVENHNIQLLGEKTAITKAVAEWIILPWFEYLQTHGKIAKIDSWVEATYDHCVYELLWDLADEHQTYFYLIYNEQ
jgi:hypothetical protein